MEEASGFTGVVKADMIRGRSIGSLVVASVYAVCLNKLGRTIEKYVSIVGLVGRN